VVNLVMKFRKGDATPYELILGLLFWVSVSVFALFPDVISNTIAWLFGIKSNVNAIIFFCIGLIFFFQFKLYSMLRRQQRQTTELIRQIALKDKEKEEKDKDSA
jgi:hypothetical protein